MPVSYRIITYRRLRLLFLALSASWVAVCCSGCDRVNNPDDIEDGSWVTYSPYKWSHDGRPYRSVHCDVFSDGVSAAMKEKAGKFADAMFMEVLELFDFTRLEDFRHPPGDEKINVYLNRYHEESIAAAYWGTIIITIRASDFDTDRYEYLFKHELAHAFEFLIEGTVNLGTEDWFKEGIAIYAGGGMNQITTVAALELWIARNADSPTRGNPISIHCWDDYPEGCDKHGYYTVYDVVMKYLLDEEGLGKSIQDVLNLFYDIRNGGTFGPTFQEHFGITVATLEADIFDRLRAYLSRPRKAGNNAADSSVYRVITSSLARPYETGICRVLP